MYNEQLEKLIEMALIDGVLTEKEKQILFKKAESFGVDLDEFEMVLDAKLHQQQKSQSKTNVNKCPSCGETISGLSKVCPSCNFILSKSSDSSELDKSIQLLEDSLVRLKSFPKPNYFKVIKSIVLIYFSFGIYILYKKFYKKEHLFSSDDSKNFATEVAQSEKYIRSVRISYGDNQRVRKLVDEFTQEHSNITRQHKKARLSAILIIVGIFITIILLLVIDDKSVENKRKNNTQNQILIEQELTKNNFEEAKGMALQLDYNKDEVLSEIYKAEVLFNIKNNDFQKAEDVFFSCPKGAYYHFRSVASYIVQTYLENNNKKGAISFINKIDVEYDSGEQQKQLKELLR
jgi:hypothetical protein